jgi:hypothetical protein
LEGKSRNILISLKITPKSSYLHPHETQLFKIKGTDQYGNDITISQVSWDASSGIIDNQGLYTAGNQEEKVIIQASVGDISTSMDRNLLVLVGTTQSESLI